MTGNGWRVVGGIVAALIGVWALLYVVNHLSTSPGGPTSSSYATSPAGLAAYADLLRREGRHVVRFRDAPRTIHVDRNTTVVMLDPGAVDAQDERALATFVVNGATLVVGGAGKQRWLDKLVERPPDWTPRSVREAKPEGGSSLVRGVGRVVSAGEGSFGDAGEFRPVLAGQNRVLLAAKTTGLGYGRIELLADASPLQNRLLDRADNALLGLRLAPPGRPVAFLESVHGYGHSSGLRAVPTRWRWALGGLVLAALALMLARGRRLGPPEAESRALPPPRRDYVEALAAMLARTKQPREATESVRAAGRRLIARRGGLASDATAAQLRDCGLSLGLSEQEVAALFDGRDVIAAGRAFARLERGSS
jgi:Domain of unknown function (DUF4350)